jgi:hAT family C-terminal dimerisation region
VVHTNVSPTEDHTTATDRPGEPPAKKPAASSVWDYAGDVPTQLPQVFDREGQIEAYLSAPLLARTADPLRWWVVNRSEYPLVYDIAKVYLAIPPTSVSSERLFSAAADIHTPNRNRLSPKNLGILAFLRYNIPKLDFLY